MACKVIRVDSNSWLVLLVVVQQRCDYYGPLMINDCMWEHASMIILALCESYSGDEGNRKPSSLYYSVLQFPAIQKAGHGLLSFHISLFDKWRNFFINLQLNKSYNFSLMGM